MAHFPPDFIDEVLARTDIVEVVARKVALKRSGSNMMGLCPFHHEKSPSFSVSPDKQLFYCFGCGKGGGAVQFLIESDGYSFPEAIEYLAEKAGLALPQASREEAGEEERRRQHLALLSRAGEAFVGALRAAGGEPARNYLAGRALPPEMVAKYGLGFAPAGYGFMERSFGRDERTLAQLELVGLLFKGERGYADRFRERLIFPIRDRRGHLVGFGGRVLGAGEPKYLNSPETPYFHKSELLYGLCEHRDEIRRRKQLLVVEGYMDVLMLAAHGLPLALAPLGTAIGERQITELFRLCEAPIFCFDGDRAGRQAAWRALERMLPLLKAEFSPRFLYLPEGEDPDSLVRKEGSEAFAARMQNEARPVLESWLEGLRILAGQGAEGRARMAKRADAMLALLQDGYLRQVWRQEAERATGVQLHAGGATMQSRRPAATRPARTEVTPPDMLLLEEHFLAALLAEPKRWQQLPPLLANISLDDGVADRIYTRAFQNMGLPAGEMMRQLRQEFPEAEGRLSRWANEPAIDDNGFADLLLTIEERQIGRRLLSGGLAPDEGMALKRRQMALREERKKRGRG